MGQIITVTEPEARLVVPEGVRSAKIFMVGGTSSDGILGQVGRHVIPVVPGEEISVEVARGGILEVEWIS